MRSFLSGFGVSFSGGGFGVVSLVVLSFVASGLLGLGIATRTWSQRTVADGAAEPAKFLADARTLRLPRRLSVPRRDTARLSTSARASAVFWPFRYNAVQAANEPLPQQHRFFLFRERY